MPDAEIVRLDGAQRDRAAKLMAAAFHDDPMYRKVIPQEARRAEALAWLFDRVVRYSLLYGEAYTTPALEGVACWLPPGQTEITLGRVLCSGLAATPLRLGLPAYLRFAAYLRPAEDSHRRCAPPSHWYLWALAVNPSSQGRGIGGRLIEHALAKADTDGVACYLETEVERNLDFYGRRGFKIAAKWEIPGQGVKVWAMLRDPEPSSECL